jgi:hypothetical protein
VHGNGYEKLKFMGVSWKVNFKLIYLCIFICGISLVHILGSIIECDPSGTNF